MDECESSGLIPQAEGAPSLADALEAMKNAINNPVIINLGDKERWLSRFVWYGPPSWYSRPPKGFKYEGKGRGRPPKANDPYDRGLKLRKRAYQLLVKN